VAISVEMSPVPSLLIDRSMDSTAAYDKRQDKEASFQYQELLRLQLENKRLQELLRLADLARLPAKEPAAAVPQLNAAQARSLRVFGSDPAITPKDPAALGIMGRAEFKAKCCCNSASSARRYLNVMENSIIENIPTAFCCIPPNCFCPGTDYITMTYFDRGLWDEQSCADRMYCVSGGPKFHSNAPKHVCCCLDCCDCYNNWLACHFPIVCGDRVAYPSRRTAAAAQQRQRCAVTAAASAAPRPDSLSSPSPSPGVWCGAPGMRSSISSTPLALSGRLAWRESESNVAGSGGVVKGAAGCMSACKRINVGAHSESKREPYADSG